MTPRVLYVGQAYYNHWYLSRELRELGWKADLVNFDDQSRGHYHGADVELLGHSRRDMARHLRFYARAARDYDVFHFANKEGMRLSQAIGNFVAHRGSPGDDVRWLKRLGKKIVYTNNGCQDAVAQTTFRSWAPYPTCDDCPFQRQPSVCSDEGNLAWGALRNELADAQCLIGGNRADFNLDPTVHEVPEVYCLDEEVWRPDLLVPSNYRLGLREETFKIYHSVGNADNRSQVGSFRNTKSTHIYVPLVDELKAEGRDVELLFFKDVPNLKLRYYQAQADVVVDMLTAGFFGATTREGLMLGKPVVCYLRPEWLEQMAREVPEYVAELPVVSATPDTVRDVLIDLQENPEKRREIGRRSREFAVKWHGRGAAARRLARLYSELLDGTLAPAPWSRDMITTSPSPAPPLAVNPAFS